MDDLFEQTKQLFLELQIKYPEDTELNSRHAVKMTMEKVATPDLAQVSKENQELLSQAIQRDVAVFGNLKDTVRDELTKRLDTYITESAEEIAAHVESSEG